MRRQNACFGAGRHPEARAVAFIQPAVRPLHREPASGQLMLRSTLRRVPLAGAKPDALRNLYAQGCAVSSVGRAVRWCARQGSTCCIWHRMTFPSRSFGRNCPAVAPLFPIRRLTIRHLSVGASAAWSLYPLSGNRKFSNPLPSSGESGELRKLARRGMACPGWLGFAPNGREPRLLMPRQSRRAVVMAHFLEAGRGDVIAPSPEIEEAGVAIVAQALLVIPSRI